MDDLLTRLKNDFNDFSCNIEGTNLRLRSSWKGKTSGIEEVAVYIEGKEPLTGEKISKEVARFSRTNSSTDYHASSLHGQYELRFEALGINESCLGSFRDAYPIRIDNKGMHPYIKYLIKPVKGWLQLSIESNCWKRCTDKLWVNAEGRLYQIYRENTKNDVANFYFPQDVRDLSLFVDDDDIPTPAKAEKSFERI